MICKKKWKQSTIKIGKLYHSPAYLCSMIEIDFTEFTPHLRIRQQGEKAFILDPIRKKELVLQPEELVRQLVLQYLLQVKEYKVRQIRVEIGIKVNGLQKRCDIITFDKNINPFLLVECKSAHIPIDQSVFDQIARYNMPLQVPYLMVTNGITTFACKMDYPNASYEFMQEIPSP